VEIKQKDGFMSKIISFILVLGTIIIIILNVIMIIEN